MFKSSSKGRFVIFKLLRLQKVAFNFLKLGKLESTIEVRLLFEEQ